MGALPKKKISRARGRTRYKAFEKKTQKRLSEEINLVNCPNCASKKIMHFACPVCGTYKGRDVLGLEKKEEKKAKKIKKIKAD